MNTRLSKELRAMASKDQVMRRKAIKTGHWNESIDKKNTQLLKTIINQFGWPTIPMVGKKASFFAWLIAQHADHDIQFQKNVLKLLKGLYIENNIVDPKNVAFLTDKILVAEGKKQIFGTQFYTNGRGNFIPRPIKDKKEMTVLRKKYDLPPSSEYLISALVHAKENKKWH